MQNKIRNNFSSFSLSNFKTINHVKHRLCIIEYFMHVFYILFISDQFAINNAKRLLFI